MGFKKDLQFYKFCFYGFFKNLRFFDPFMILFFLNKGISYVEIGLLYSVREIIIMIMEIPSGVISDAIGRKKTLILSFVFYITSFTIFYISINTISLFFGMALFALAEATRTGIHKAMIFNYLKVNNWSNYKIDYYGNTRAWSQTGSAISAIIAAVFVYISGNYNMIFIASIFPYLLNMGLIASYPAFLDGDIKSWSSEKVKQQFKLVYKASLETVSNLKFFNILSNLTLYTGYYRATKDYLQPIIKILALGLPFFALLNDEKKVAVNIGIIYSLLYLLTAIASKKSGWFTTKFRNLQLPMNITLSAGIIIGITIGISMYFGYYLLAILGMVIILVFENLRKPIGVSIIADLSNDKAMATVLSLTSQAKSIFAAIIAPIIGWLADVYSPGTSISIVSITILFMMPLLWLRRTSKA